MIIGGIVIYHVQRRGKNKVKVYNLIVVEGESYVMYRHGRQAGRGAVVGRRLPSKGTTNFLQVHGAQGSREGWERRLKREPKGLAGEGGSLYGKHKAEGKPVPGR